MNITLNIPVASFERLLSAIERIADAADRFVHPITEYEPSKPYGPEMWGTSSNAQSIQIEEEDRREALGYGAEYQRTFEDKLKDANLTRGLADFYSGDSSRKG